MDNKPTAKERNYQMVVRPLGDDHMVLSGRYSYDSDIGFTMEAHIRKYVASYDVVSHCIYGADTYQSYSVIMKLRYPVINQSEL